MTFIEGMILGIVQGLTEFLPVSSSGHLILMQKVFGFTDLDRYVFFDLVAHLGTLLAVVIVFRKSIMSILVSRRIYILYIILGVAALVPFKFAIPFLKGFYNTPEYIGFFFIATALFLLLGELSKKQNEGVELLKGRKFFHCMLIGASQLLAVLPGVSRSGTTVSVARMLGWDTDEAAEFSFLLSVPVILMGALYEGFKVSRGDVIIEQVSFSVYAVGFLSAFAVGVVALKLFLSWLASGKFKYLAVYCAILGIFCLIYF